MAMKQAFEVTEPTRDAVDSLKGPTLLEFGAPWCEYCRAAQPLLSAAFADHPGVHHLKVEDGKGRPLGRSFQVKLWPTLIFLRDGKEVARLVRPESEQAIRAAFTRIDATAAT